MIVYDHLHLDQDQERDAPSHLYVQHHSNLIGVAHTVVESLVNDPRIQTRQTKTCHIGMITHYVP